MQEGEALNGNPVESKGKTSSCETSEITNMEDGMRRKNISREKETKRRKKHVEGEVEQENDAVRNNVAEEEIRKKNKRKRKIKEQNLNNMSSNKQAIVEEVKDVEPTKKKKRKSQNSEGNREKRLSDDKSNGEQLVIVNGHGDKKVKPQESTSLAVIIDTTAINGDTSCSPEISDHQKSNNVGEKVLKKATSPNEEPFAKFQKNFTPPAFVRKSLRKIPRTEPQKSKTSHEKVSIDSR